MITIGWIVVNLSWELIQKINMEKIDIIHQLDCVEKAIQWTTKHLQGDKLENSYNSLVNQRRQLKKIGYALADNPAAAIYGESQKGKSYLVSSLLSSKNSNFYVVDATGIKYDFKNEINPLGQNKESTSVVTRFSSQYNWINDKYPVKVQLLSLVDVLLVLSDTYYSDLKNQNIITKERINTDLKGFNHYFESTNAVQKFIQEDDILDIKEYFEKHFKTQAHSILASDYFDIVSKKIKNIPIHDWANVFAFLWNNNPLIIELFKKLVYKLQEIDFADSLYVPYKAVLRKHGTLLDVDRLIEINNNSQGKEELYEADTEIFYIYNNQEQTKTVKKSFLCALTAELVFRLPDELKDDKSFLNATDLLDFPGARARLENNESDINEEVVPEMLLRGKVAYLFNKYEANFKINTLLFCHDKDLASQRFMPTLLNNWVKSTVGESDADRNEFISKTEKSPLFIIATKFNLDLKIIEADKPGNLDSLNHRWNQRFTKVLSEEIINVNMYDWFTNWTTSNKFFNNIYLLRDYYYSSEMQDQLYKGFSDDSRSEKEEIKPLNYPEFREDLKQSFLRHEFVKQHFDNPEISWNEATQINKDGTALIIENLTTVTQHVNEAREQKLFKQVSKLNDLLIQELKKHYHTGDSDDLLNKAKQKAGRIQAKLAISSGRNPFFFAELINTFMISESKVFNHFRNVMNNLNEKTEIRFDEYANLRMTVSNLDAKLSFEENLKILSDYFEYPDTLSCIEYFEAEKIDLHKLFFDNTNPLELYSVKLAESIKEFWLSECKNQQISTQETGLNEADKEEILSMFSVLFDKLHLTQKIASNLEVYVDRYNKVDLLQEMLADIAAETINNFVYSVGFNYFSEVDKKEFEVASEKNNLGLHLNSDDMRIKSFEKNNVAELFEKIDNLPKTFAQTPLESSLQVIPSFMNYKRWNNLLKFGFIAVCDIPNYDVKANEELGEIINLGTSK